MTDCCNYGYLAAVLILVIVLVWMITNIFEGDDYETETHNRQTKNAKRFTGYHHPNTNGNGGVRNDCN
ncbi:MAG: hypothetical protein CMB80_08740 [Flammeovirgaceae bacterium]|nr:hypothetical protein [Flammeovirgaceae bacterium]|tara:strand:- start:177 stop:380 length:204 start_codon:yes stop_codon:yes gene_type:complete